MRQIPALGGSVLGVVKRCARCGRVAAAGMHQSVRGWVCNDLDGCVARLDAKLAALAGSEMMPEIRIARDQENDRG